MSLMKNYDTFMASSAIRGAFGAVEADSVDDTVAFNTQVKADAAKGLINVDKQDDTWIVAKKGPHASAGIEPVASRDDMEASNLGLPVEGYRPQTDWNVSRVNANKLVEEKVLQILDSLSTQDDVDKRWLAIGRTAIEQGFMAVNRAIFKPERAKG